ncbi:osmotically inducible protein OsmC [Petrotoga sp. 9PW.55.5.1]|uniref:OsmC family protein n=1 Tax=Petrotoga sp. 9PW.55.5.1 TaxID=1308979 RepID=UPI000DC5FAE5|nr:OsmC family protein [Petrotoga sp. 9PW.55.5.1]RAO98788.1 osmotically inducible protein OsmC [Petrotoga sp. 9PW.55.5.1]
MTEFLLQNTHGSHFYMKTPSGHDIHVDASPENLGYDSAPRPMEYLIAGLGGCTGIDAVTILNKMRVNYDSFNLRLQTERSEEHPKKYTKIHVIYEFKGKDLPMDKLERAAQLSQEKYCGATATFRGSVDITYEVKVVE